MKPHVDCRRRHWLPWLWTGCKMCRHLRALDLHVSDVMERRHVDGFPVSYSQVHRANNVSATRVPPRPMGPLGIYGFADRPVVSKPEPEPAHHNQFRRELPNPPVPQRREQDDDYAAPLVAAVFETLIESSSPFDSTPDTSSPDTGGGFDGGNGGDFGGGGASGSW